MLDRPKWKNNLIEVHSYKGKWNDKKDVLYWRGMHSGQNQTDFDEFDYTVNKVSD
jgi:hypothetical protein